MGTCWPCLRMLSASSSMLAVLQDQADPAKAIHVDPVGFDRPRIELARDLAQESRSPPTEPGSFAVLTCGREGVAALLVILRRLVENVAGHQRRPHAI